MQQMGHSSFFVPPIHRGWMGSMSCTFIVRNCHRFCAKFSTRKNCLPFFRSFGKVVSGMDVVSAIEQVGSESGVTRVPVVIADSGQLR
jgi:cyclophilin family peptidyl-prolyl cis-trans isomerase